MGKEYVVNYRANSPKDSYFVKFDSDDLTNDNIRHSVTESLKSHLRHEYGGIPSDLEIFGIEQVI